jgi:hypothetical protein
LKKIQSTDINQTFKVLIMFRYKRLIVEFAIVC